MAPLPSAAAALGGGHQGVEVDPAGGGQHDVARAVAAVEIIAHRLADSVADTLGGAQHAAAQRMRAVVGARHLSSAPNGGWSSYIWISSRITCFSVWKSSSRSDGPEDVGQQVHRALLVLGQHGGVKHRVLLVGEGVVVGAHLVELAVHVVGRAAGRALERHVFEEMAHPGHLFGFIARPGVDEEPQRRRVGLRRCTRRQFPGRSPGYVYETPTGTSNRRGPSVTTVKSRGGCSAR